MGANGSNHIFSKGEYLWKRSLRVCVSILLLFIFPFVSLHQDVYAYTSSLDITQSIISSITMEKLGEMSSDEIWSGEILITDTFTVPIETTLTILPGTIVRFLPRNDPSRIYFYVNGRLYAEGTKDNPITFTSASDNPQPGDWGGIQTQVTTYFQPISVFDYVIMEYSHTGFTDHWVSPNITNSILRNNSYSGIVNDSCAWCQGGIIENNQIYNNPLGIFEASSANDHINGNNIYNNTYGIYLFYYPSPVITCNNIHDNTYGIYIQGYGYNDFPVVNQNSIINNTTYSIYNGEHTPVNAKENYWGTVDSVEIAKKIIDGVLYSDSGIVDYSNYLSNPPACVPSENRPPVVNAGGPYMVDEGGIIQLSASGSDPDNDPLDYFWDIDGDGSFETDGQSAEFSASDLDGPSLYSIAVKVVDTGGLYATDQTTITILNVPPVLEIPIVTPEPSTLNGIVSVRVNFNDPSGEKDQPFICEVDYGDNSGILAGTVIENTCIGVSHTYSAVGIYQIIVSVTDQDGGNSSISVFHIVNHNYNGFFQPVDNLPVMNVVKGGRAIPVKFSLGGNQGLNIIAENYPKSQRIACDNSAPLATIEETVTAGMNDLKYDVQTNQYIYTWKTDTAWIGTCRQFFLLLNDGTIHKANFKIN